MKTESMIYLVLSIIYTFVVALFFQNIFMLIPGIVNIYLASDNLRMDLEIERMLEDIRALENL